MAAAAETKAEVKEVEEHVEPLICKTCVLKVSLHCEGCKRKAKKVLRRIDGVYNTDIDLRQQKVVVTGNVDSQTLINKLIKQGFKHVELWPEKADNSKKEKQAKTENKEKQTDPESGEESNQGSRDNERENVKVVVQDLPKCAEVANTSKQSEGVNVIKVSEGPATAKTCVVQIQEPKPEVKQTVILPAAGNQPPTSDNKVSSAVQAGGETEAENNEKSGGSTGGKKKKKKGPKGNNNNGNEGEHSGDASASTGSANQAHDQGHGLSPSPGPGPGPRPGPMQNPTNQSPPRHYYSPNSHYYAPPVHTVSHHTAHPSGGSTTSYYAAPPPHSYTYHVNPSLEREMDNPLSDSEMYTSRPSDSFEFFSDENPNGCSVM